MSYNGSGTFLINSAGQPVVPGTTITTTAFNALTADLASGLTTAITKDGQTVPTANIPMGGFKLTGLGAGTSATDAAQFGQLQNAPVTTLITVAGADTITGTLVQTLTAYATGQQFSFVAAGTNTTAVTLNIDGLGAKAVTRTGAVALAAGALVTGQMAIVEYDGTRFQLINANAFTNLTLSGALTYGGVTLASSVTGTSSMVLSASPTLSGTVGGALTWSGAQTYSAAMTYGGVTLANSVTGTGSMMLSASPTTAGTLTAAAINASGLVAMAGAATVGTTLLVAGATTLTTIIGTDATDATSITTGAFKTAGGLGVAKALWVGGLANVAGAVTLQSTLGVTGAATLSSTLALGSSGMTVTGSASAWGFGVAPSTWSIGKAVEVGFAGNGLWADAQTEVLLTNNVYYNSGYKFAGTGYATFVAQSAGEFSWYVSSASGTAGNAATMGLKMNLNTSGNLAVGGFAPSTWSLGKAVEVGTVGNSIYSDGVASIAMRGNSYYSGTEKFAGTGYATSYLQYQGSHYWYTSSASGTAGNTATMNTLMSLSAAGALRSGGGTTGSIATATATTLFTPSVTAGGNYLISAYIAGTTANVYGISALLKSCEDNTGLQITEIGTSSNIDLTVTGAGAVQVTQTSGGNQVIKWSYLYIG